jgi:hypothetical protein
MSPISTVRSAQPSARSVERKLDVLAAQARDINPEIELKLFPQGVSADDTG